MPRLQEHVPYNVFLERRVHIPQPNLGSYLGRLKHSIGNVATVSKAKGSHLTVLEPTGAAVFREHQYAPDQVRKFSNSLKNKLNKAGHGKPIVARVDPEDPLIWVGAIDLDGRPKIKNGREEMPYKLAIGLENDERMVDLTGKINEAFLSEFGKTPKTRAYRPHITIAEVLPGFRDEYCELAPEQVASFAISALPSTVALNGLVVVRKQLHMPLPNSIPLEQPLAA